MLIYLICLSLFISILFFRNKIYSLCVFIIVFCIMGFRDMVGSMDIYNYAYSYEVYNIREYFKYDTAEIGFQVYTALLKFINGNRYFYFFVTAFVIGFLQLFSGYKISNFKEEEIYLISFLILCKFYLLDFIVLKQMMAMGFVWMAISQYYHNNTFKGIVFLLIACLFHRSAFILLPLSFLLRLNLNFKTIIILFTSLLILIYGGLVPVFVNEVLFFIKKIPYLGKASIYATKTFSYKWIYIIEIPIILFVIFKVQKLNINEHQKKTLANSIFVYGLFTIISIVSPIMIRIAWFLFISFAFGIALIITNSNNEKCKTIYKTLTIVYFSSLFLKFMFTYYGGDMLPYKSIFQDFDRKGHFDYKEYRKNR